MSDTEPDGRPGADGTTHLRPAELAERLGRLPRYPLATLPTPLQPMERLSFALGGPRLLVKRDDLTGLAFGGNKVRQMEYFTGDALAAGADTFIGGGAYAQSNHARICAAGSRAAGLEPVIVVRPATQELHLAGQAGQGNALITAILCDDIRLAPELEHASRDRLTEVAERRAVFEAIAAEYRARGARPYVLVGSSVGLGVMGYVAAALELQAQFEREHIAPDFVVVTSLGVTQAGLELAVRVLRLPWSVVGMAYMPAAGSGSQTVARLMDEAASLLKIELAVDYREIVNLDEYAGPRYGVPSSRSSDIARTVARCEGILLDPIYSAKGMAGLAGAIEHGRFGPEHTVVFLHTGGQPAVFAYGR
ncbi:MAG TPA: pyridoxal-phosphate dependent enzyme [Streptosporangiaceae bacterium]|jgi:1-aminocyclopropane-1-carboxylate deaminase/D-cysteine desulfhydrase-like pyridoxal-dependent ACC family enzyme